MCIYVHKHYWAPHVLNETISSTDRLLFHCVVVCGKKAEQATSKHLATAGMHVK